MIFIKKNHIYGSFIENLFQHDKKRKKVGLTKVNKSDNQKKGLTIYINNHKTNRNVKEKYNKWKDDKEENKKKVN